MPERLISSRVPTVGGVVVTYHPDSSVPENLRAMTRECGLLIVVDNGSSPEAHAMLRELEGVMLLPMGENVGVATALNRGIAAARAQGYQWVITFDQDSQPQAAMLTALWSAHLRNPQAAVIAPRIKEHGGELSTYRWLRRHPRYRLLFQRAPCGGGDLNGVTIVVTSGSLIDVSIWDYLGGFDEDLFIDYVDVDYCLRVVRARRDIVVAGGAILQHRLGARRHAWLLGRDFRPTYHAPFRHYYISRNRVRIWLRHAIAVPHWALFDFMYLIYNAFRTIFFEDRKLEKLRAMMVGTWHGIIGRTGRM